MNTFTIAPIDIQSEILTVKQVIKDSINDSIPLIRESVHNLLDSSGKMIRPTFLMLSSKFGQIEPERMYKLAAGVELIHMASLIHDDIIDNSRTRRHKPTLHRIYGKRTAVLMGDYLFSKSFSLLAEHVSADNQPSMPKLMERICEGEILQDMSINIQNCSMRTYVRQITAKTALLFTISFHLGAIESGCSTELSSSLRRVGYNIGMSFQVIDDILDFTGSESTLGKPRGSDLREGIFTAPILYALTTDDIHLKTLLRMRPYSKRTLERIIQRTEELGGIDRARKLARLYTNRALREIGKLPDIPATSNLLNLSTALLNREF